MIEKLKEQYKMAHYGWHYSIQRIDLLMISISGAGIYVCLEAMKYSFENSLGGTSAIKIAGLFFVVAIVLNFISQFTGMKANQLDMLMSEDKLDCNNEPDELTRERINNLKCSIKVCNTWTFYLNTSSMAVMFIGLIVILKYFWFTF